MADLLQGCTLLVQAFAYSMNVEYFYSITLFLIFLILRFRFFFLLLGRLDAVHDISSEVRRACGFQKAVFEMSMYGYQRTF